MRSMFFFRGTVFAMALTAAISGFTVFKHRYDYTYDNAGMYVAGEQEISDRIEALDIDYEAGDVVLLSSTSDIATVVETSKEVLCDDMKVHTWLEGTTLHIRYCAANSGALKARNLHKKLTVTLPADVVRDNISVAVTSGDIVCENIDISNLTIKVKD